MNFAGAVLTGGASRRMGRDKALLRVGGRPLVRAPVAALERAGATSVVCIGGDLEGLGALGLTAVADDHPGEGPLGGVVTALARADSEVVVVLSCDLPRADATAVRSVVDALLGAPPADAAVPVVDGHRQYLHAAYRRRTRTHWAAAFAAGERSVHRAGRRLAVIEVGGLDPDSLRDVDRPDDLPGLDV